MDTIKALFEAGADINAVDDKGKTALQYANYDEVKKLLKQAGVH